MEIYTRMVAAAAKHGETVAQFLRVELPHVWHEAYVAMTPARRLNVGIITRGSFDYYYDDQDTLIATGEIADEPNLESRLMAVLGITAPDARHRDDSRLRGWLGPTDGTFGRAWDKGHFIAHSIGGAVAGSELNVFIQRRDLNRGWSPAGRRYRAMETYCATHPGVLCWSRPIYTDDSAMPLQIEYGILKTDGELWVETFDNWWAEGEFHAWRERRRRATAAAGPTPRSRRS
ncbi:MAG TPA: hypothetical protein VF266_16270 [Thermoanaerobaculia bacterium]